MTKTVILLRAINAGVPLKMDALRAIASDCGYANPRTYIASGNLLIDTDEDEAAIRANLGAALERHVGAPVGLLVRTADELDAVLAADPFPDAPGNRAMVLFLDSPPTRADIDAAKHRTNEEIALGARHLYLHFPEGQGTSRLSLPLWKIGTARNVNTVTKLATMAREA
ncbi:DUF1697 domain-containing protein [Sphingomicrobium nitratireducens]|uniref:DUF1697 domain-containing protein n=1 Tax=Sphingomicrobium nitratireducens TaxID=2964666 RepID=UPI00223F25BC|nr:DUF1697 domain-containing protein [Sphingomicrobium nitratireducens]